MAYPRNRLNNLQTCWLLQRKLSWAARKNRMNCFLRQTVQVYIQEKLRGKWSSQLEVVGAFDTQFLLKKGHPRFLPLRTTSKEKHKRHDFQWKSQKGISAGFGRVGEVTLTKIAIWILLPSTWPSFSIWNLYVFVLKRCMVHWFYTSTILWLSNDYIVFEYGLQCKIEVKWTLYLLIQLYKDIIIENYPLII